MTHVAIFSFDFDYRIVPRLPDVFFVISDVPLSPSLTHCRPNVDLEKVQVDVDCTAIGLGKEKNSRMRGKRKETGKA